MPYPLTETGRLAREYGISYACAKYRIENGIPLDAPVMTPLECGRNVQNIYQKKMVAERQARMVWQAEQAVRRAAREKLARERRQAAQRRRAEVEQRREDARITITAAPRKQWQNPLALLAGAKSRTTASPTARTTSAASSSTASSVSRYGS